MPTAISARITPSDEEKLRTLAARLSANTGVEVTLTDAFLWLLDQHPDTLTRVARVNEAASVSFGAILTDEQLATLDRLAGELAARRALVSARARPNRSEALRYVIRSAQ